MRKDKQIINCEVHDCMYCDCVNDACCLKEIKVSNCNHKNNKESTMCDSYMKR